MWHGQRSETRELDSAAERRSIPDPFFCRYRREHRSRWQVARPVWRAGNTTFGPTPEPSPAAVLAWLDAALPTAVVRVAGASSSTPEGR